MSLSVRVVSGYVSVSEGVQYIVKFVYVSIVCVSLCECVCAL